MPSARLVLMTTALALGLAACDSSAPYSNVLDTAGRGVGFSDYAQYMRAQEELSRIRRAEAAQGRVMGAPMQVAQGQPVVPPANPQGQAVASQAVAALRGTPAPVTASGQAVAPVGGSSLQAARVPAVVPVQGTQVASAAPVTNAAGVSNQQYQPQPFGTPTQNQVITRDFVPQVRVSDADLGAGGPNLFNYALSTSHRVGEQRYTRRHLLRWRQWEAACAQFANQDLAQEAFLAAGGPERDPENMDPDGDGFACWWDPAPFRQAATTVRARQ